MTNHGEGDGSSEGWADRLGSKQASAFISSTSAAARPLCPAWRLSRGPLTIERTVLRSLGTAKDRLSSGTCTGAAHSTRPARTAHPSLGWPAGQALVCAFVDLDRETVGSMPWGATGLSSTSCCTVQYNALHEHRADDARIPSSGSVGDAQADAAHPWV